jgi:FkbM family methyltransferase
MFQFIYDQACKRNNFRWHFFNLIRMRISRFMDPAVRFRVYGREISLPFSHPLPILLKIHPFYSTNLTRLAVFLRAQLGRLIMVDVGANIGDSYCSVDPHPGDSYLLVEGEPHFYNYLLSNTRSDPSVECAFALLSDEESGEESRFLVGAGNATLQPGKGGPGVSPARYTTLDRLIESRPVFRKTNLVKVDVEGYDRRVLKGGREFLAESKPVIFFEHHPQKIAGLGEDVLQIFQELAGLGYGEYIVYDNLGYLLGIFSNAHRDQIADAIQYAAARRFYFDIVCFHETNQLLGKAFLDQEKNLLSPIQRYATLGEGKK